MKIKRLTLLLGFFGIFTAIFVYGKIKGTDIIELNNLLAAIMIICFLGTCITPFLPKKMFKN